MSDSRLSRGMGHCVACVCLSTSSCAQGGTPAVLYLHMWVRAWLRARVECYVCVCMSGWNMWVFAGEWDDFYRRWFTWGLPCPGLFKMCQVPGLRNDAQLQDHAKTPWGLAGVADAGRVRKSMVFDVARKLACECLPPESAGDAPFVWTIPNLTKSP